MLNATVPGAVAPYHHHTPQSQLSVLLLYRDAAVASSPSLISDDPRRTKAPSSFYL
jgi:hypothetical protein